MRERERENEKIDPREGGEKKKEGTDKERVHRERARAQRKRESAQGKRLVVRKVCFERSAAKKLLGKEIL